MGRARRGGVGGRVGVRSGERQCFRVAQGRAAVAARRTMRASAATAGGGAVLARMTASRVRSVTSVRVASDSTGAHSTRSTVFVEGFGRPLT